MTDALTYWTELFVGVACLVAALPAWRRGSALRWLAAVLAIAGLAAAAHAVTELL